MPSRDAVADETRAAVQGRRVRDLFNVSGPETKSMRLGDGVELAADLYRPESVGRFPVMLMRQPYGRRIASTVVLAHPAWYAAHGYVVVVQDVRGRSGSTGDFRVLADDAGDGAATLAWAADLSGTTGQVATYGFSYQAMTQLLALAGAARAGTKRPDAIVPAMGAWTVRDDWAFEGGAFRLAGNLAWALQMGVEQARRAGDRAAFTTMAEAARGAPWSGEWPARPETLALLGVYAPHYEAWLRDEPATRQAIAPATALQEISLDTPSLFVGGWFDGMLEGTLAMHAAFEAPGSGAQRLLIGPWLHLPWNQVHGTEDLGPEAASPVDGETIGFLDHHLKGRGGPGPAVRLFDVGRKSWCDFARWPAPNPSRLFLFSDGRATVTASLGRLLQAPGTGAQDRVVHDPWRPAPIAGGHLGAPPGLQDRSAIDDRTDVAVYTTTPLERCTSLVGRVAAELHAKADAPSFDLHCTLSVLYPGEGGRAMTLSSGHRRICGDGAQPIRIPMRATCATLPGGARLRLSVQAAAFPAFAVNPGTGQRPEDSHPIEARVTTLTIAHGGTTPSCLLLPVLS